jgi:hypothetical protein
MKAFAREFKECCETFPKETEFLQMRWRLGQLMHCRVQTNSTQRMHQDFSYRAHCTRCKILATLASDNNPRVQTKLIPREKTQGQDWKSVLFVFTGVNQTLAQLPSPF